MSIYSALSHKAPAESYVITTLFYGCWIGEQISSLPHVLLEIFLSPNLAIGNGMCCLVHIVCVHISMIRDCFCDSLRWVYLHSSLYPWSGFTLTPSVHFKTPEKKRVEKKSGRMSGGLHLFVNCKEMPGSVWWVTWEESWHLVVKEVGCVLSCYLALCDGFLVAGPVIMLDWNPLSNKHFNRTTCVVAQSFTVHVQYSDLANKEVLKQVSLYD